MEEQWNAPRQKSAIITTDTEIKALTTLTHKIIHKRMGMHMTRDLGISTTDFEEALTKIHGGTNGRDNTNEWRTHLRNVDLWKKASRQKLTKLIFTSENTLRPYVIQRGLTEVIEDLCRKQIGSSMEIAEGLTNLANDKNLHWGYQNTAAAISIAKDLYENAIQNFPPALKRANKG